MTSRLISLTHDITLGATEKRPKGHEVKLAIMYDENAIPVEMMFVGRGKIGEGMDDMLKELGIKCSRALQGRDPETGG
jgi:hypothetical protein